MTPADPIHFYQPSQGHGLPHDPFNAIVGPRPIGWIASRGAAGGLNLAPYSFFNAFNYTPPIIGFASIGRKDTLRNIEETGEFVWNLATRPLAEAMNASCAPAPAEVDEFALAGLTPAPSRLLRVPRVAESPVAFECRKTQIIQLQGGGRRRRADLAGAGRGGGRAYRAPAAARRGVRHGRGAAHPAWRRPGRLF